MIVEVALFRSLTEVQAPFPGDACVVEHESSPMYASIQKAPLNDGNEKPPLRRERLRRKVAVTFDARPCPLE